MVETICKLADLNEYSSVEYLLHFAEHWNTYLVKRGATYHLCSSVGFNHTTIQSCVTICSTETAPGS